ncbi:DUF6282 family protein [Xenorhabdus hominickii]|uniref:Uncharacterized protein n=1 Tax=Xenorhabdus hominickii TaxID=351679 RepID=A0A1V0M4D4_XENHO|nr:DUF6282 family protein [Xenorhabdus hominickii]ARD69732.1 hypothetical protein [Xenorhabdus hominickii]PHM51648.1 hypothetical protein Xhom_04846 [Xenorhabdus hominickii]
MKRAWANTAAHTCAQQYLSVVDSNGRVRKKVHKLIRFAQQYDVVLSSGHVSCYEVMQLIDTMVLSGFVTSDLSVHFL